MILLWALQQTFRAEMHVYHIFNSTGHVNWFECVKKAPYRSSAGPGQISAGVSVCSSLFRQPQSCQLTWKFLCEMTSPGFLDNRRGVWTSMFLWTIQDYSSKQKHESNVKDDIEWHLPNTLRSSEFNWRILEASVSRSPALCCLWQTLMSSGRRR